MGSDMLLKLFPSPVKDITKLFLYEFIHLLVPSAKLHKDRSILLIRTDAIGDYILFRNFIEILKSSKKYRSYSLTLVGNIAWRELAETLDAKFVDDFIWIDRKKFMRNPLYRYRKLREIASCSYDILIAPVYSRDFHVNDAIVKVAKAREKIGSMGDLTNITRWQKKLSDKYYTRLIPAKNGILFEFYRNKEFFENLLGEKININKPFIESDRVSVDLQLPTNYAVIFIGGSHKYKRWRIDGFAEVAKHLKQRYNYHIVLCGGKEDERQAQTFEKFFGKDFTNLVGKTTLTDLIKILHNASIVVSNESSVPHLAIAVGDPCIFVIFNGDLFGRFAPYPKEIFKSYYTICHPIIENNSYHYEELVRLFGYTSRLNINDITPSMVIEKISKVLDERKIK